MKNTTADEAIPITEFVTASERNLTIAEAVCKHYADARQKIVDGFAARLRADLEADLPGWSFRYDPIIGEQYGFIDFFKETWKGKFAIRLEGYEHGAQMIYGVWRDATAVRTPQDKKLLAAVRTVAPRAKSRPWFEAEILMTTPADDWLSPHTLWRIHTDDKFRAEIKALLLEVKEISEPHVDRLAAKLKR